MLQKIQEELKQSKRKPLVFEKLKAVTHVKNERILMTNILKCIETVEKLNKTIETFNKNYKESIKKQDSEEELYDLILKVNIILSRLLTMVDIILKSLNQKRKKSNLNCIVENGFEEEREDLDSEMQKDDDEEEEAEAENNLNELIKESGIEASLAIEKTNNLMNEMIEGKNIECSPHPHSIKSQEDVPQIIIPSSYQAQGEEQQQEDIPNDTHPININYDFNSNNNICIPSTNIVIQSILCILTDIYVHLTNILIKYRKKHHHALIVNVSFYSE